MEKTKEYTSPYEMDGRIPWPKAIVYGLQHVLAMFVGNLTPLIVICGACGIGAASDFAEVYVELLQNAMIIAGVVTLVQLFAIGPVGGRVPIIMGTSSGFIGVFKSVAGVMGGASTEIDNNSKNVVLEAAVFDGKSVRKTSSRLNLRSESSSRFEKGINNDTVLKRWKIVSSCP